MFFLARVVPAYTSVTLDGFQVFGVGDDFQFKPGAGSDRVGRDYAEAALADVDDLSFVVAAVKQTINGSGLELQSSCFASFQHDYGPFTILTVCLSGTASSLIGRKYAGDYIVLGFGPVEEEKSP